MNPRLRPSTFTIIAATLVVALVAAPASAKDKQKAGKDSNHRTTTSAAAAASHLASVPEHSPLPKPGQRDSKPGVAWKTVGGTVKEIRGETYTVEDYDGRQMTVHFGQGTKHLRGDKKVGDHIRAEITHGGFANSIQ
ncbi:MAG: hypothetical protein GDA68_18490 [Nitrospira sp. CR2.1]|nr:hypothetical protein [Nitrospira sp. CR2.1]